MKAGMWAGGQAYALNYKKSLEFAIANWEKTKIFGTKAMFIDTTTAQQYYESYDPAMRTLRQDDRMYRLKTLQLYKQNNQLLGSEEASDFALNEIDWLDNRHTHIAGESIPLWSLVFHDCVINCRYKPDDSEEDLLRERLTDLLYGYCDLQHLPTEDQDSQLRCTKNNRNSTPM